MAPVLTPYANNGYVAYEQKTGTYLFFFTHESVNVYKGPGLNCSASVMSEAMF
jgi:hypothetical protein